MKKKVLNAVSTLAIAAIVALNVHVVTSEKTPAFLKWDVIGKILAQGTSGSGSGSGSGVKCSKIKRSCSCYDSRGNFMSMSILECEDYTAYPPQECSTCVTTKCVPKSSC